MTLIVCSLALLMAFAPTTSAGYGGTYTYTDRDSFSYNEDLGGDNRGFNIQFSDTDTAYSYGNRGYTYCKGQDYYSWRSSGCRDSYGKYYGDQQYPNEYNSLDHNAVLKEAFKTYQQSSKQQYQLESQRIKLSERRFNGYGGSGARYYRYGW